MNSSQFEKKYKYIIQTLETMRSNKQFSTTTPVTEQELAKQFKINRRTMAKLLQPYIAKGLLKKVRKKGIVTVDPQEKTRPVGLIMNLGDHFYSQISKAITEILNQQRIPVNLIDSSVLDDRQSGERIIDEFSDLNPQAVIIDGSSYCGQLWLNEYTRIKKVFLDVYDAGGEIPGSGVFIDFEAGISSVVRHLISLGHKKIVLAINQADGKIVHSPEHRERHSGFQAERAYLRIMNESGFGDYSKIYFERRLDGIDPDTELAEMMKNDKPDAFVCLPDAIAVRMIKKLVKMGFSVPDDVAFTGFLDTPWAEMLTPTLTSLNVHPREIARMAVTMATDPSQKRSFFKIIPELVIRESSQVTTTGT